MAAYISFQPSDFFNVKTWSGNSTDARSMTGVGFQPDWVWIKSTTAVESHTVWDSPRGVEKVLYTNANNAEATVADGLQSFNADGYTIGTEGKVNSSGNDYVGFSWKMGTTTGLSGGTITPSAYRLNETQVQGICKYDGNSTTGASVPHGLGVKPDMIIIKKLSDTDSWWIYHKGLTAHKYIDLPGTSTPSTTSVFMNNTEPTSTLFYLGASGNVNGGGDTYVAYAMASKRGYSKIDTYRGNGNSDGSFVYTGFRPAYLLLRNTDNTNDTPLMNSKVEGYNTRNDPLYANLANADTQTDRVSFMSNGFKLNSTSSQVNENTSMYIYAAFAEFPFVSSNSKPGTAR